MGSLFFVDANIFFYAFGAEHRYKNPCSRILQMIEAGEAEACTNSEVLQEILYRSYNIGRKGEGIKIVRHLISYFPLVLAVGKEEVDMSLRFLEKHKNLIARDAIHVATMAVNNISTILSADKDFDQVKEIKRVDPLELA